MNDTMFLKRGVKQLATVLAVMLVAGVAVGQTEFDKLLAGLQRPATGYVADYAGVLSEIDKAALNSSLRAVNETTNSPLDIVIVTLSSLKGGEIDDFTVKLFEKWGIGEKGKDNGVLILTAMEERSVRIETGYGAEGMLNAARCGNIRDTIIVPNFKEQRYAAGFDGAIKALVAAAGGMPGTGAVGQAAAAAAVPQEAGGLGPLVPILVFVVIVVVIIILARKSKTAGPGSSGPGGGISGGGLPGAGSGGGSSSSGGGGGGTFGGGRSGGGGASGKW